MKRTLIIFLIIIFNINISHAKNDSNITIEELDRFMSHLILNQKYNSTDPYHMKREYFFPLSAGFYYHNLEEYELFEIEEELIEYYIKFILSRGVEPIPRNLCEIYIGDPGFHGKGYNCDFKEKEYLSSKDYLNLLEYQSSGSYPKRNHNSNLSNNDFFSPAFESKYYLDRALEKVEEERKAKKRRLAKCLPSSGWVEEECIYRTIKGKFSMSKKSKQKFPGDIFYAFAALEHFLSKQRGGDFTKTVNKNTANSYIIIKKKYQKRIEKFRDDPTNDKILGKKLIRTIKSFRSLKIIRESIGVHHSVMFPYPDVITRYFAMGDMLNSRVGKIKKNKKNPDIKNREVLLKKYSNTLFSIKKKLEQNNYKNLDANVLILSTVFKKLNELPSSTSEFGKNFDLAIDSISDSNKLIEISTLNAQKNDDEKLLALSSIKIMENLISSISNNLPDEYKIIPPKIENVFSKVDNQIIEQITQDINVVRGNELSELTQSMNIVDKVNLSEYAKSNSNFNYNFSYKTMNSSDVMKTLNNLGMKNTIDRSTLSALNKRLSTPDTATEAAAKQLKDSLDREWAKEVFNNMSVYENVSNVADQTVQNIMNETSVNNIDTSTPEGAKEWGKEVFGSMSVSGPD